MGQSQNPVSSVTQQLTLSTSAVASATGTATFTFQSPPQGVTWTGTLTCAGSPATSIFLAVIGATSWGDWAGASVYGPVQAFGMEQLIVTATGLTSGVSYDLEWTGSSDASTQVQPIFPDPVSSAQTVQFAQGTQLFSGASLSQTGGVISLPPITLPSNIRTLIVTTLDNSGFHIPSYVSVASLDGTRFYYEQPPYLYSFPGTASSCVICPVNTVLDPAVIIQFFVPLVADTYTIKVFGDTAQYDESVFYNGPVTTVSASGPGTIVYGPCRLLALTVAGGESGAAIQRNVPAAAALLDASAGLYTALSFGSQGIIIPYGDYLSLTGGGGGTVTYTYP